MQPLPAASRSPSVGQSRRSLLAFTTYDELIVYLRELLAPLTKTELSRSLGFRSTSSASMFLSGRRRLTINALESLSSLLRLSADELVHVQRLSRPGAEAPAPEDPTVQALSINDFTIVSRWFHGPLFSLLATVRKMPSLEWLEKRLRGKVKTAEILRSLAAWEQLGFVKRTGRNLEADPSMFFNVVSTATPSPVIRTFHREMIERAREAIEEQAIDERTVGCTMFTMHPDRMREATMMIERFRDEFRRALHDETGTEVCQLNYQMFWHTDLSTNARAK